MLNSCSPLSIDILGATAVNFKIANSKRERIV